jgi:oxygen-dependent protoporphyrinogen oxidase
MQAEGLVSVVHAYRRADVGHALDGFGYLVPASAGSLVLGTLFSSTLDPGSVPRDHVSLRSLLGGARRPDALQLGDAEILERVAGEHARLLGITGKPVSARVARHPAVIPRFDLEHPARRARLAEGLPDSLALLGNFTRGLGVESLVSEARAAARTL